jgi:LmbE family N-acetylglucosaminyl deacetylase
LTTRENEVTTDELTRLLNDMEDASAAALVLSPHLDDAVLSCGALLAHLATRHPVTVATVFTAAAPPPWSLPARRALRELGRVDAEDLFAQRREEDRDVLAEIGAEPVNLGFRDALFRRGRRGPAYPTYRFDAARGRVASCDTGLAAEVSARVSEIARAREAAVVFAPLGVGRHVDHLITRQAAHELGRPSRIVYYSDFPYSLKAEPEAGFVRRAGLVPHPWHVGRAENANRIAGYRTQFAGLFRDGTVPTRPEIYWLPANDSTTEV